MSRRGRRDATHIEVAARTSTHRAHIEHAAGGAERNANGSMQHTNTSRLERVDHRDHLSLDALNTRRASIEPGGGHIWVSA